MKTNMSMKRTFAALVLSIAVAPALGEDSRAKTAIGGGVGAAAGAAVGDHVGGKTGAVVGGAAGGAVGAATTTRGPGRTGAVIGGAVGGGAGAAIGQEAGGKTGAIVGAGVGGAAGSAIGRGMTNDKRQTGGKPQTTVVVTQRSAQADDGNGCKHKKHPGKGWAKGHAKHC